MNMDVMSAGNYARNYANTNTVKSTESTSFADAMEERAAERKKEYGDETIRHAAVSANPSFTVTSYEEIMKDWYEQIKANQEKNYKPLAEVILEGDPQARYRLYKLAGSSKVYTFDEYVRNIEEELRKLNEKWLGRHENKVSDTAYSLYDIRNIYSSK